MNNCVENTALTYDCHEIFMLCVMATLLVHACRQRKDYIVESSDTFRGLLPYITWLRGGFASNLHDTFTYLRTYRA